MLKSKLTATAAIALAMGLGAGAAQAQSQQAENAEDHCVPPLQAQAEGQVDLRQRFQEMDADSDGFISMEEYKACLSTAEASKRPDAKGMEQAFLRADKNVDERISEEEFHAAAEEKGRGAQAQKAGKGQKDTTDQQANDQTATTIKVEESQPEVTVEQPAPEVTVTVEQPEPEVQVTQAEPSVQVQEGSADQAEPEVTVRTEEPEVTVETTTSEDQSRDQQAEQQQAADQPAEQQSAEQQQAVDQPAEQEPAATDSERLQARAEEIIGQEVINQNGEEVGDVEDLVVRRGDGEIYAVIGVGGFLGLGEKSIAVPFSELDVQKDQVVFMSQQSEDQLEEMPEYNESEEWQSLRQAQPAQQ